MQTAFQYPCRQSAQKPTTLYKRKKLLLLFVHSLGEDWSRRWHQFTQTSLKIGWSHHQSRQCHIHHRQGLCAINTSQKTQPGFWNDSGISMNFGVFLLHHSASSTVVEGVGLNGGPSPCPRRVAHFWTSAALTQEGKASVFRAALSVNQSGHRCKLPILAQTRGSWRPLELSGL